MFDKVIEDPTTAATFAATLAPSNHAKATSAAMHTALTVVITTFAVLQASASACGAASKRQRLTSATLFLKLSVFSAQLDALGTILVPCSRDAAETTNPIVAALDARAKASVLITSSLSASCEKKFIIV